jgi:hypothetical protein
MGFFKKKKKNVSKIQVANSFFGTCVFEKEEGKNVVNLVEGIEGKTFGRYAVQVEIKVEEAYVGTALDELEKLFTNAEAILEQIYPAAMEQCNDWDEEDFEGNTISLEYIRKYYELRDISITYAAGYGIYADLIGSVADENGGELLGDHDFVAEYECKTGEISFDLWG